MTFKVSLLLFRVSLVSDQRKNNQANLFHHRVSHYDPHVDPLCSFAFLH